MTCPQCGLYPINEKSKHKLCIKCGYIASRQKLKEKRQEEKENTLGKQKRICPQCKTVFTPRYKDHNFCTPECQKSFKISSRNTEWGKKKKRASTSRSVKSVNFKRMKNVRRFSEDDQMI